MHIIDFEPVGRRGECPENESLLESARRLDVDIVSPCGGVGVCKHCKVQITAGKMTPLSIKEKEAMTAREITQHYRLACQASPLSDVTVHVPPESLTAPQRTQIEGLELNITPDPAFQSADLGVAQELAPPDIENPLSDEVNLISALARRGIHADRFDFTLLQKISTRLRAEKWQVKAAVRAGEIIALGSASTRWCGMAVDIGTTKIAVYLIDMATGQTLASKGLMNPQISYGEDVVARIYAASRSEEGAVKLQRLLVESLNATLAELCTTAGVYLADIVDAVIVANTAVHHLFLKLPTRQLGLSPYVPALRSAIDVKARDLGLTMADGAYVHLLPNIAGYVGADHVAMILGTRLGEASATTLALDIGTNTEICLNHRGRMASVSCASGPAFEGAHIKHGMRAAPGAIEHVYLDGERLEIQTIDGLPPVGICGSGLLDVVAQMRKNNVLDASGRMLSHPRVRVRDEVKEFVLAARSGKKEDITVSQKDVRELQIAKAAIRLGVRALVEAAAIDETEIDEVIVAGAFGTFIDLQSAITIGMLPPLPLERFRQVGNAAGTGARLALLSMVERRQAAVVAGRVNYIELATIEDFNEKLAAASAMIEA